MRARRDEEAGYVYGRFGNPTVTMFEDRLALIEGADACQATATGMAAVFAALMSQLRAGDHVVASPRHVRRLLRGDRPAVAALRHRDRSRGRHRPRRVGARAQAGDPLHLPRKPRQPDHAGRRHCRGLGARSRRRRQRRRGQRARHADRAAPPSPRGADVVVYSTTKHIDGQGRCLGGAILGDETFFADDLVPFMRTTGPVMSPFNAWVMLKGLETPGAAHGSHV